MPAQEHLVRLECQECERINYRTRRNRKITENPLELKKFCKWCRKHTLHKDIGKK